MKYNIHKNVYYIFLLSLLALSYNIIKSEKVLVNIDRIVKEIDENTSCDISQWANKLTDACKCCLIKLTPQLDEGKSAEDIIKACIEKKYCTQSLIELIEKDLPNPEAALRKLYNTSVIIKTIDTRGVSFDAKGNFTEEGLKTFLEKAYEQGKLPYEDFKSVTCLNITNIFGPGKGIANKQLFLINSNNCTPQHSSYVLKESAAEYKEVRQLANFFNLKQIDRLSWPKKMIGYPSLSIPISFLRYSDHYLILAPTAPGIEVQTFLIDYIKNRISRKTLNQVYFNIGYAIALFHQKFMTNKKANVPDLGVIHGDFHHQNIFYDQANNQTVLIDNIVMPETFINPRPVTDDPIFFIFAPLIAAHLIPSEIRTKLSPSLWINLVTTPLLQGYISAFPQKNWSLVFDKLTNDLKTWYKAPHIYPQNKQAFDNELALVREYIHQPIDPLLSLQTKLIELENTLAEITDALENNK